MIEGIGKVGPGPGGGRVTVGTVKVGTMVKVGGRLKVGVVELGGRVTDGTVKVGGSVSVGFTVTVGPTVVPVVGGAELDGGAVDGVVVD